MAEQIGDGPVEGETRELLNSLAHALDRAFNGTAEGSDRPFGFVLMQFRFGDIEGGRVNYISNARRQDIVVALREQLAYFEGQAAQPGGTA